MQRFQQIQVSDITGKWGVFDNETDLNVITAIFQQETPAAVWTLQHNMDSSCFLIEVYRIINGVKEIVTGYTAVVTSNDIITITFSEPVDGEVELLFFNPVTGAGLDVTPSPTPTQTLTPTGTRTPTPTPTASRTFVIHTTPTSTPTRAPSPTRTATRTPTGTPGATPTTTPTPTRTPFPTPSNTATISNTPSVTPTKSGTPTQTRTPSNTPSTTRTPTSTPSNTPTKSGTPSVTPTHGVTQSVTPTKTPTPTKTRTPGPTPTPSPTHGTAPSSLLNFDMSFVDTGGTPYSRFKSWVDTAVAAGVGHTDYGFEAMDAAMMYHITNQSQYANLAIQMVEQQVADAEADIAANQNPEVSGDSYLEVGGMIRDVGFVYTWCNAMLSGSQKTRWAAYANQTLFNVWNPDDAVWGSRPAPWSGWSVNDPGNNYYYSFLTATICWACASNNASYLNFLTNDRIPLVVDFYSDFPGGGTREGTGYGLAASSLIMALIYWHDSGQGDPMNDANSWIPDTMNYWIHATAPTLDKTAAIGDQSRVSEPIMYDYQRALVLRGRRFVSSATILDDTSWWLHNISVAQMGSSFNLSEDLFPAGPGGTPPAALTYYSSGAGVLFTRTAWTTSATWLVITVGRFDQSHAHEEQGGFTFYKNNWLSVTENIWSHSGIQQGSETNNVLRFVKAGNIIGQNRPSTPTFNLTSTGPNGEIHATANLKPAYSNAAVISWNRTYDFVGGILTITDNYSTDGSTTTYFQVQTKTQPVVAGNIITAGNLKVTVQTPSSPTISIINWTNVDSDYLSGYRIDISGASGTFVVKLEAI